MMSTKLIILDADVIIYLHENNLWNDLLQRYAVIIAETVAREFKYFTDPKTNHRVKGDLTKYENEGFLKILALDAKNLIGMKKKLPNILQTALDPGEEETIGLLYSGVVQDAFLCLADNGAINCAVFLDLGDKCISLETVFRNCDLKRKIEKQYSDEWFNTAKKKAKILKVQNMKI